MRKNIHIKNVLGRAILPNGFLPSLYRFSPYQGCGHGCVYCDGRAEKYYIEGDFEKDIGVRVNLCEVLAKELKTSISAVDGSAAITAVPEVTAIRASASGGLGTQSAQQELLFSEEDFMPREKQGTRSLPFRDWGAVSFGTGVSDVYQPLEAEIELTRKSLAVLAGSGAALPVVILTKSALVLRDFDLLKKIGEQARDRSPFPEQNKLPVMVLMTITCLDEAKAALLENGASPPDKRLEVIRRANEAGFHTGVMAMPMAPFITDGRIPEDFVSGKREEYSPETETDVLNLFRAVQEAGAEFIMPGGLTLRPGRQKDLYMNMIKRSYPELYPVYERIYGENRQSGMPCAEYTRPGNRIWQKQLYSLGISMGIPHAAYRSFLSLPDSFYVLLCHMEMIFSGRQIQTRPLVQAIEKYGSWLKTQRKELRKKRGEVTGELEKRFKELICGDGFEQLISNPKLAKLARETGMEGRIFNYITGKTEKP